MALADARRDPAIEVVGLLVTVNAEFNRVAMHGVRRALLEAQAARLGLPLVVVEIPFPCPDDVYDARLGRAMAVAAEDGVRHVVFGDLFLEDIRAYREERLAGSGIEPLFPLWGRPTAALAETMIRAGVVARIVSLDPARVPRELAGRVLDRRTLAALPPGVDPCGENGEFHTCVTDGPMFAHPIPAVAGPVVERDGFVYADLALAPGGDDPTPAAPSP